MGGASEQGGASERIGASERVGSTRPGRNEAIFAAAFLAPVLLIVFTHLAVGDEYTAWRAVKSVPIVGLGRPCLRVRRSLHHFRPRLFLLSPMEAGGASFHCSDSHDLGRFGATPR